MTHTPGPWIATQDSGARWTIVRAGNVGLPVFALHKHVGEHHTPNIEANARLIAAAPELLEALGAMIATVDRAKGRPVTFYEGMRECSLTKARSAVAKARGN